MLVSFNDSVKTEKLILNSITLSLFKFLVSKQTFANISSNALMTKISTIIEMYEDILPRFYLSLNLKSYMFNKLQKNSGAAWDNIKFKDYFQIKCLEINNFTFLILSEISDNQEKMNRNPHKEMYITRRKIDDPEFFKNYFESYPFSENC